MIEEIKKEISNLTAFNGGHNRMYISDLFKILDKYKDKEDKYKNAWEELREDNQLPIPFIELLSELMQNLEEKYGIEVE